jgi:hypothetical protein
MFLIAFSLPHSLSPSVHSLIRPHPACVGRSHARRHRLPHGRNVSHHQRTLQPHRRPHRRRFLRRQHPLVDRIILRRRRHDHAPLQRRRVLHGVEQRRCAAGGGCLRRQRGRVGGCDGAAACRAAVRSGGRRRRHRAVARRPTARCCCRGRRRLRARVRRGVVGAAGVACATERCGAAAVERGRARAGG